MKTPDMEKENNFVLREAANAAVDGYYDHLAAGGKGDPAEERWIEALIAGADAITTVAVLESRLAQSERERDELFMYLPHDCTTCRFELTCERSDECNCGEFWQWRGVCPENTKEEK